MADHAIDEFHYGEEASDWEENDLEEASEEYSSDLQQQYASAQSTMFGTDDTQSNIERSRASI